MTKNLYRELQCNKAIAVIRTDEYSTAKEISIAAIKGGIKVIEVTMTVPNATNLIMELKDEYKDIIVGAGTVLREEELVDCVNSNADFIVSPCVDEKIIEVAKKLNTIIIPGVMTITELNKAYFMGIRYLKVFPGNVVGKDFIKAAKSIYKDISIMPTGGVNNSNVLEWLQSGADSFGIGSDLNKIYNQNGVDGIIEYCRNLNKLIKENIKK